MPPSSLSPHLVRPFDQRRAPREAGSHSRHQYECSGLQHPVLFRVRESERNRTRRSVAEPVDVHHDFLLRKTQLLRGVVDDAYIGLVRDVNVNVLDGAPALVEEFLRGVNHDTCRELENLATVHLDEAFWVVEVAGAAPWK